MKADCGMSTWPNWRIRLLLFLLFPINADIRCIPKATMSDSQMDNQLHYSAVFEPAEEGGYMVTFPAIPGLATQGETLVEARAMAADCLRAYLESLRKDGEALPYEAPDGPITERLTVELASA